MRQGCGTNFYSILFQASMPTIQSSSRSEGEDENGRFVLVPRDDMKEKFILL